MVRSIHFPLPFILVLKLTALFRSVYDFRKKFIENNTGDDECRTYENLDALRMQVDNTDSASLHFESILEGDISQANDTNDANSNDSFLFENYDIPRSSSRPQSIATTSYENTSVNNNGIERKKSELSHKYPNYAQPKNELTDNALFNKFRASADGGAISTSENKDKIKMSHWPVATNVKDGDDDDDDDVEEDNDDDDDEDDINADESNDELSEGKLRDSNSVSCEDLLEFANSKPKGKERGIESDEVRIMTKVLGTNVSISSIEY